MLINGIEVVCKKKIYCCGCERKMTSYLVTGADVYPHRRDLASLRFWKCPACQNYVGTDKNNKKEPMRPLGCIPTPELREARKRIHAVLDPMWKNKEACLYSRSHIYKLLSTFIGGVYHTAEIRTLEEAAAVLGYLNTLKKQAEEMGGSGK